MRRSTIVMLILLALLAGLYWYMQQPNNVIQRNFSGTPTATVVDLGYVVSPEQGQISSISIETAGATLSLDNNNGAWLLTTATGTVPANPNAADSTVSGIQSMRILSKLEPAPDPVATGLDQPAFNVSITMSTGATIKFKVGKMTVTQSGYYVEQQDGSVVVVNINSIAATISLLENPPYLFTPTPSPIPPTATPSPTETPLPSATPEMPSPTPTP
jgi:hypothetical protein